MAAGGALAGWVEGARGADGPNCNGEIQAMLKALMQ